jgi:hypothetical protein
VDIRKEETEVENFTWTDNSANDFNNWAADCTGREDHPDCTPEAKQQQWYDWNDGEDPAPFICKKPAKQPSAVAVTVAVSNSKIAEPVVVSEDMAFVEKDLFMPSIVSK